MKHKTKDKRRQEEHSPNQDRTKPLNQTNKRETKPGTEPHGGMQKDAYHTAASGSKSQCGADCTVKVCFDHFFGPCFRGHDEAGLLAFEALQGLPRPARGTTTKQESRRLESIYYGGTPMRHRKKSIAGSVRELNHFKQQRKALRQASQLCCFGLQMQFVTVF